MYDPNAPKLTPVQCAALRRMQRMPQAQLAAAINKSQVHISNYERGKAKLHPREEKIICRVLGIGRGK